MQPFQCDLQPQLQETHRTTHTWTSILAKHIGGTNRVRNDRSRNRRTDEVPFIAGCSHFTRKNTRFYYVLLHYVLFCDLPPFIKVNCIASILLLCIVTSCIVMWSTTLHHSQFHSFLFLFLCIVRLCIVTWSTTLHHSQFHRFLFFLLCIVMLCIVRSRTTLHHSQLHQVKVIRNSEVLLPKLPLIKLEQFFFLLVFCWFLNTWQLDVTWWSLGILIHCSQKGRHRLHACAFRDYSLGFSTVGPFENIDSLSQARHGNQDGTRWCPSSLAKLVYNSH